MGGGGWSIAPPQTGMLNQRVPLPLISETPLVGRVVDFCYSPDWMARRRRLKNLLEPAVSSDEMDSGRTRECDRGKRLRLLDYSQDSR